MDFKNLRFVCALFFAFLVHAKAKAIVPSNLNQPKWPTQQLLFRRNPDVTVQSEGLANGSGKTTANTRLVMNEDSDESSQKLDVQSNAAGSGGNVAASTKLSFSENDDDRYGNDDMTVRSDAKGVAGDGGATNAQTSMKYTNNDANGNNSQLDVQADAEGNAGGNGNSAAAETSLRYTEDDDKENSELNTKTDAIAISNSPTENYPSGTKSRNSLQIDDDKEGDINLNTTGLAGGGAGGSQIVLEMEDGQNTRDDLTVHSTTKSINDSEYGTKGTETVVLVNDEENDRSIDARVVGVDIDNDEGSGGLIKETVQYRDVDVDHEEIENIDENGISRSVTREVSDNNIQNSSSDYNFVTDDGTTIQTTTQTKESSTVVKKETQYTQSFTTENEDILINQDDQLIQNRDGQLIHLDQEEDSVEINEDKEPSYYLNDQGVQVLHHGEDYIIQTNGGEEQGYCLSDQETVALNQDEDYVIRTNVAEDHSYLADQETLTINQGQDYVVQTNVVEDQGYLTNQETKTLNQGQDYLVQTNVVEDQGYLTNQKTKTLNQGQDYLVQTNVVEDEGYLNNQETKTLNQGQDYLVQTNVVEDQNYLTNKETRNLAQGGNYVVQTNVVEDQGYLTNQETKTLNQGQDYLVQTNVVEDQGYLTNQETKTLNQGQDYLVQTNVVEDQNYLTNKETRNLAQGGDYEVQTNVVEDQGYLTNQETTLNQSRDYLVQTNVVENQGYSLTEQETMTLNQGDNYVVQTGVPPEPCTCNTDKGVHAQNHSEDFVAQTDVSEVRSVEQTQTTAHSENHLFSQPTIDTRPIDTPLENHPSAVCPENNQGPGVVCYYQASSFFEYGSSYVLNPDQIVTDYCDVLVVSYAVLDVERLEIGSYSEEEERLFAEILKLKNDKLKIILQLQYVAFYEQYVDLLTYDDNILKFISSVLNYLQKWNFDGIELPLMVPQFYDNVHTTAPLIKQRYPALIQNLKTQLQQNDLSLSICLPIEPEFIDLAYDISDLMDYVDWFSVNTLDYNVPDQGVLRHTSPLTPESLDDPFCIDYTVTYLIDQLQVPADKVIVNVALYGSTFLLENYNEKTFGASVTGRGPPGPGSHTDGFLTLSELCSLTQINWLNNPAVVTDYDDVPTLVMKVTYIRSRCLGGVGIHAITMDDPEGHLCGRGPLPFTRAVSLAYNPFRDIFLRNKSLEITNYIDPSTTNKYLV